LSIDQDAAGRDQVFGFAAGRDSRGRDNFLEAFGWHGGYSD
jgi:hypothetical protein